MIKAWGWFPFDYCMQFVDGAAPVVGEEYWFTHPITCRTIKSRVLLLCKPKSFVLLKSVKEF